jgi:hypothetical protein
MISLTHLLFTPLSCSLDPCIRYADQTALAEANADNSLLQYRGNAGSHDMALGTAALRSLAAADTAGVQVAAPRYDKSVRLGSDGPARLSLRALAPPVRVGRHRRTRCVVQRCGVLAQLPSGQSGGCDGCHRGCRREWPAMPHHALTSDDTRSRCTEARVTLARIRWNKCES